MSREDIIRMAREAGLNLRGHYDEPGSTPQELERFAALVAAAKDAEHQQTLALQQRSYEREIEIEVEAEREACAKVCDDKAKETFSGQCQVWGDYFARAIRARSNT